VKAVTSALTLHEVLTGARKAGDDRLFSLYRDLIGTFPNLHLIPFDARIAEISSDLRARYDLPTPDAIQVATALQQGAETFVTNDARLKRIRELRVTLPRKVG
jgi:predicted nucleic acid-binding protein